MTICNCRNNYCPQDWRHLREETAVSEVRQELRMHGPVGCHPATERSGNRSQTLPEAGGKEGRNGEGGGQERKS